MDQGSLASLILAYAGRGLRYSVNFWITINLDTNILAFSGILCAAADSDDSLEHILQIHGDQCVVNLKSALLSLPFHKSSFLPDASFPKRMNDQMVKRYEDSAKRDTHDFCDIATEKIMSTFIFASRRAICDHLHIPLFDLERNHTIHIKNGAYSLNPLYYWRNKCLQGFYEGSEFGSGVKNDITWHIMSPSEKRNQTSFTQKPDIDVHRPPRYKRLSLDYLRDDESWLRIAFRGRRRLTLSIGNEEKEPKDIAPYWDKRTVSKRIFSAWLMVIVFGVALCMGGGLFGGLALISVFVFPYLSFYSKE
mmetsp:Transcript_10757/g.16208  ORF Transcript_10757/g.16208 Transcript_10757/m.16208 type:complete len:307 (-) Transcript_10757:119-1039(-)|eukprot:CAMPEP_0201523492 /NCGR_PEP_ID=MMETSP0161_2-20130828/20089_1 /ASSEMBLY_ACC=CAM_ASM_000251 /TAXON_ID=180227 /ORGANISM="Neoparamoeba aestuarina, Strain SoJaBio B1-5/56/2" /LENGTH=306 /DNA_ID=CAMNT_0047922635 /DNA_START=15 /DNA_END=935 /DNA_ORIENTATION=+